MPDTAPSKADTAARKGVVKFAAIITATSLLIGASFGVQAIAENKYIQHATLYVSDAMTFSKTEETPSPFVKQAGWNTDFNFRKSRGWGRSRFSEMTPEQIEKRVTRIVKHVAIEVDATKEQEEKITALVTALAKDMQNRREGFRDAGKQMHKLLIADTIDRNAIEKLRAERLAEADKISREVTTAIADVAEVLNAEQRKILNERVEQFRSIRKRWHRG